MAVTRRMLFPLAYYKKARFHGSTGSVNYRIERVAEEEDEYFLLTFWNGPYCYDVSKEEKKSFKFEFSEEGMEEIISRLQALEKQKINIEEN